MQTWFLCVYPKWEGNRLLGLQFWFGLIGWKWWGVEVSRFGVKRLRYEVVA